MSALLTIVSTPAGQLVITMTCLGMIWRYVLVPTGQWIRRGTTLFEEILANHEKIPVMQSSIETLTARVGSNGGESLFDHARKIEGRVKRVEDRLDEHTVELASQSRELQAQSVVLQALDDRTGK